MGEQVMLGRRMESSEPVGPQLLSDAVPLLREDVVFTPKPGKGGLFEVGLKGGDKTFTLYDFEVSIARMLNGRRPISELIEAASRIGIPVTLDSFQKFVRQMKAYGFIAEQPPAPQQPERSDGDGGPWAPRAEWTPEVREHFRSALRTFRMDRLSEARSYVEALLQIQPEVSEAVELLARIEARAQELLAAEPVPPPAQGPVEAAPEPAGAPEPDFAPLALEPPLPPQGPSPAPVRDEEEPKTLVAVPKPAMKRRRAPAMWAGGAAVLLIASGAALPVAPCKVSAAAELSPAVAPVEIAAARDGQLAFVLTGEAPLVESGVAVAKFDDRDVRERLLALERELGTTEKRITSAEKKERSSRARKAAAAVTKKERELQKLEALLEKTGEKARSKRALASISKKVQRKKAELERARKIAEAASGKAELEKLTVERDALQKQKVELEAGLQGLEVASPGAGVFTPARREGDRVKQGDVLGAVQDVRQLRVRMAVPATHSKRLEPGQPVRLRVEGQSAPLQTTVSKVSQGGAGFWSAEATIDNATRALPPRGIGLAEITCGQRSLAAALFD